MGVLEDMQQALFDDSDDLNGSEEVLPRKGRTIFESCPDLFDMRDPQRKAAFRKAANAPREMEDSFIVPLRRPLVQAGADKTLKAQFNQAILGYAEQICLGLQGVIRARGKNEICFAEIVGPQVIVTIADKALRGDVEAAMEMAADVGTPVVVGTPQAYFRNGMDVLNGGASGVIPNRIVGVSPRPKAF